MLCDSHATLLTVPRLEYRIWKGLGLLIVISTSQLLCTPSNRTPSFIHLITIPGIIIHSEKIKDVKGYTSRYCLLSHWMGRWMEEIIMMICIDFASETLTG